MIGGAWVTEKELRSYRTLCKEADNLDRRIRKEQGRNVEVVSGKVKASMPEFPFTEIRVGVEMEEPAQAEARGSLIRLYQGRLAEAERRKLEVEQFIGAIGDPELRLIFQYRYIDGSRLFEIGERLGMDRSSVGKRIKTYMEKHG